MKHVFHLGSIDARGRDLNGYTAGAEGLDFETVALEFVGNLREDSLLGRREFENQRHQQALALYALGRSLRRAIESWEATRTVAVIATGGMSHLLLDENLDNTMLAAMQAKDEKTMTTAFPEDISRIWPSGLRDANEGESWLEISGSSGNAGAQPWSGTISGARAKETAAFASTAIPP